MEISEDIKEVLALRTAMWELIKASRAALGCPRILGSLGAALLMPFGVLKCLLLKLRPQKTPGVPRLQSARQR